MKQTRGRKGRSAVQKAAPEASTFASIVPLHITGFSLTPLQSEMPLIAVPKACHLHL